MNVTSAGTLPNNSLFPRAPGPITTVASDQAQQATALLQAFFTLLVDFKGESETIAKAPADTRPIKEQKKDSIGTLFAPVQLPQLDPKAPLTIPMLLDPSASVAPRFSGALELPQQSKAVIAVAGPMVLSTASSIESTPSASSMSVVPTTPPDSPLAPLAFAVNLTQITPLNDKPTAGAAIGKVAVETTAAPLPAPPMALPPPPVSMPSVAPLIIRKPEITAKSEQPVTTPALPGTSNTARPNSPDPHENRDNGQHSEKAPEIQPKNRPQAAVSFDNALPKHDDHSVALPGPPANGILTASSPASDMKTPPAAGPARQAPAADVHEIPETASVVHAQPAKEISIRLTSTESTPVDIKLVDREGSVRVAVRTADPDLTRNLQSGLSDLVHRLEHKGFEAEVWSPTANSGIALNPGATSNGDGSASERGTKDPREGMQQGNSEQQNNGRNRPKWVAELEERLATGERG